VTHADAAERLPQASEPPHEEAILNRLVAYVIAADGVFFGNLVQLAPDSLEGRLKVAGQPVNNCNLLKR
jgi:hypothetical protein